MARRVIKHGGYYTVTYYTVTYYTVTYYTVTYYTVTYSRETLHPVITELRDTTPCKLSPNASIFRVLSGTSFWR